MSDEQFEADKGWIACALDWKARAEAAEARCAELEGEWDVGFTEGLRAMRERIAVLVEKEMAGSNALLLAGAIRALPLEDER